jgi:hypothetical protein|tara:strand:- start:239 stop:382 length:144 start_codon:yes stop_codon:yes gene_type:complete
MSKTAEPLSKEELVKLVQETCDSLAKAKWSVPFFATDSTNYFREVHK